MLRVYLFVLVDRKKIGYLFVCGIVQIYFGEFFCVQHCAGVIFLGEIVKLRELSRIFPPKIMLRVYLFVLVDRKKIGYLFVYGIVQIYFARR